MSTLTKQHTLNSVQIVFDQDAAVDAFSTPIGVNLPLGVTTFDVVLDVDAGGTGNLVITIQGRLISRDGATKSAWINLATTVTAAAGVAVYVSAAVAKADEYRIDVTTAQTGSPGNFRVWILP